MADDFVSFFTDKWQPSAASSLHHLSIASLHTFHSFLSSLHISLCQPSNISPTLLLVLTHINISLTTGKFPSTFIQARVTQLITKQYSITQKKKKNCVWSSAFLQQNNLLDNNHCTETAPLTIADTLLSVLLYWSCLLLWHRKPPDSTVHHLWLGHHRYRTLWWLPSYITGRYFNVSWREWVSESHTLITRVTCGSVLAALLSVRKACNPGQIPSTGLCQSWPPNNPHPLNWLYHSLSSPPVAGLWWAGAVVLWQPSHHPSGCWTLVLVEEVVVPSQRETLAVSQYALFSDLASLCSHSTSSSTVEV